MAGFIQSQNDFPVTVSLGNKVPAWGLSRWDGTSPLRFLPFDDEGYALRGDRTRLVYKGRKRSYRFTILGDSSFEYDVILEREPESNVIMLPMEGAAQFDFYKQPDFIKDPFLAGSYAVYKKETIIGEGTGKLCHIHRPLIVDARGRRCWGDLSIAGNCLYVTIPEKWLAEAKYPVLVDPTIGTTTVGSHTHWDNVDNDSYDQLFIEASIAVNRFLVPQTMNNTATAYVYAYERDYDGDCKPVLYSDNNNTPLVRRTKNEGTFDIAVGSGKTAGWRSALFTLNTSIAGESNVWFGISCLWFAARFDYGAKCHIESWDDNGTEIPEVFPQENLNYYYNFKLSMYFEYSSTQNYIRKITQGLTLCDIDKRSAEIRRNTKDIASAKSKLNRIETFYRNCVMTANTVITVRRYQEYIRRIVECIEHTDDLSFPIVVVRTVADNTVFYEVTRHKAGYIKTLEARAGNTGNTTHIANYRRIRIETVKAEGVLFRFLAILVRVFSPLALRDYFISRFLKAREELKLKSCINRELLLDSKIS